MARKKRAFRAYKQHRRVKTRARNRESNAIARFSSVATNRKNRYAPELSKKYIPVSPRNERKWVAPNLIRLNFPEVDLRKKICGERRKRKEVLFAFNKIGKGIKIHTDKIISLKSLVRC